MLYKSALIEEIHSHIIFPKEFPQTSRICSPHLGLPSVTVCQKEKIPTKYHINFVVPSSSGRGRHPQRSQLHVYLSVLSLFLQHRRLRLLDLQIATKK